MNQARSVPARSSLETVDGLYRTDGLALIVVRRRSKRSQSGSNSVGSKTRHVIGPFGSSDPAALGC